MIVVVAAQKREVAEKNNARRTDRTRARTKEGSATPKGEEYLSVREKELAEEKENTYTKPG